MRRKTPFSFSTWTFGTLNNTLFYFFTWTEPCIHLTACVFIIDHCGSMYRVLELPFSIFMHQKGGQLSSQDAASESAVLCVTPHIFRATAPRTERVKPFTQHRETVRGELTAGKELSIWVSWYCDNNCLLLKCILPTKNFLSHTGDITDHLHHASWLIDR